MKLVMDLHTHTISSGHAYSTLIENVQAAEKLGFEALATTDHGSSMPGAPHEYHFYNLLSLPKRIGNVRILRGIEANIIDRQGQLDMSLDLVGRLDIVLAGLHYVCYSGGTVEENSRAMAQAMANPFVDIIVHPGNPEFEISPEIIMEAAAKYQCAVEINNSSLVYTRKGSKPFCKKIAELAKEYGTFVSIGSDAHFVDRVGEFDGAAELLQEIGMPEELILNTSQKTLDAYLLQRRARR